MEILFVFYGINAFKSYRGTSIFEVSGIELRKWHHLCATFSVLTHDSRSDIFLYLNGKIVKNCEYVTSVRRI